MSLDDVERSVGGAKGRLSAVHRKPDSYTLTKHSFLGILCSLVRDDRTVT